ncbi:MAG: branched-chain amino acid ABC transporter permease [Acidiferrobacterales bacterium]
MSVIADTVALPPRVQWLAPAGLAVVVIILPWLVADYQRIFIAEIFIWGLFALSFALVYGFGGMLSFAQAVFFGMGCYGFNLGSFYFGFGTWGAVLTAIVVAAMFALPVGFIATRARHHHFLIVTIIVSVLIHAVLASGHWKWIAGPYVTRSLTFVPEVPLGFTTLSFISETVVYYFTVSLVGVAVAMCWLVVNSPFGRALLAIRDNEMRAQLIGLNVNLLRWMMFVVAAAVAGLAGSLYALLARYTNLEFFHWTYSGKAIVLAIIGGVQSLVGPFLGTAFYMICTEYLSRYFEQFIIVFGIILLLVIRYSPDGLWGLLLRLMRGVVRK